MENNSDYNLLSAIGDDFSLADWQASGLDTHTEAVELDLTIDRSGPSQDWSSQTDAVLIVSRDELLSLDYFGRPYPGDEVPVGPCVEGWSSVHRRLKLAPPASTADCA